VSRGVVGGVAGGTEGVRCFPDTSIVGVEPAAISRSQLGESGAVGPREFLLLLVDAGRWRVEDFIVGVGLDGNLYCLSVDFLQNGFEFLFGSDAVGEKVGELW